MKRKKDTLIRDVSARTLARDASARLLSLQHSPSAASMKSLRSTIITGTNGRVKLIDKHEPLE